VHVGQRLHGAKPLGNALHLQYRRCRVRCHTATLSASVVARPLALC
jgi:hypothetical protein